MRRFLKYSLGLGLVAFGYDEYNERYTFIFNNLVK